MTSLMVKFVIGLMGLIAAYFTLTAAVINADDGPSPTPPVDETSVYDDSYVNEDNDGCIWDGSYNPCGGSR